MFRSLLLECMLKDCSFFLLIAEKFLGTSEIYSKQ